MTSQPPSLPARASRVSARDATDDSVSLRQYLESSMREGDERLRVHIEAQFDQVRSQHRQVETALESADKLELARLASLERQITLQLAARDVAIEKAEAAAEKRFESVNEFRATLSDQATSFLPREVYESQMRDVLAKLDHNTRRLDEMSGTTAGTRYMTALMISVAVVAIALTVGIANYLASS